MVLATGTPITNTMAEVWTMMNFVAPDILDAYNINSFDEFATTFGTVEPSLEFTATGNFKIAERFKSYTNVPELIKAFRSHTDVVLTEDVKEFKEDKNIPKLKDNKMTNVIVEKNEDLEDVIRAHYPWSCSARLNRLRLTFACLILHFPTILIARQTRWSITC